MEKKKKALGARVPKRTHELLDELVVIMSTDVSKASKEAIVEKAIDNYYEQQTGKKPPVKSRVAERYGAK